MTTESMQEIVDKLQPLKQRLRDSLPKAVLDEIDGKKWLPVSFVVFVKDEGPCDPYNNGDHSDCCDHECKVDPEGGYAQ